MVGIFWSNLGTGLSAQAQSLKVYNGNLYVSGQFLNAGNLSAPYIAKWNGNNWSTVSIGANNRVEALTVLNNKLYAGGFFTSIGGVQANYIAEWNGSSWANLGTGTNNWVFTLSGYGNDLYAGGLFTVAGNLSANYLSRWSSSATFIFEKEINQTVKIFPNPIEGDIQFLANEKINKIEILNLSGELITSSSEFDWQGILNLHNIAIGIYVIKIYLKDKIEVKKLIIKRE